MRRLLRKAKYELSEDDLNKLDSCLDKFEKILTEVKNKENLTLKEDIIKMIKNDYKEYADLEYDEFINIVDDSRIQFVIGYICRYDLFNKCDFFNTFNRSIPIEYAIYLSIINFEVYENVFRPFYNFDEIYTNIKNNNNPQLKINISALKNAVKEQAIKEFDEVMEKQEKENQERLEEQRKKKEYKNNTNFLKKQGYDLQGLKKELKGWKKGINEIIDSELRNQDINEYYSGLIDYEIIDEYFVDIASTVQSEFNFFTETEVQDILRDYYDWTWFEFDVDGFWQTLLEAAKEKLVNVDSNKQANRILKRIYKDAMK